MVLVLCAQIFFCRILDVSLATVRTILTVRGKKLSAAAVGFVEVFIWFLIVRSALSNDDAGVWAALAYAGGFAMGTYLGVTLADRFLKGYLSIQVVTTTRDDSVVDAIREAGFAVSVLNVNSSGYGNEKYMLVIEIRNDLLKKLEDTIYRLDPSAFIMARETKYIHNGFFK